MVVGVGVMCVQRGSLTWLSRGDNMRKWQAVAGMSQERRRVCNLTWKNVVLCTSIIYVHNNSFIQVKLEVQIGFSCDYAPNVATIDNRSVKWSFSWGWTADIRVQCSYVMYCKQFWCILFISALGIKMVGSLWNPPVWRPISSVLRRDQNDTQH